MRAGDADRQRVADRLRLALDEGRLSLGEYDDRLREAYAARTYADLDRLLTDLPPTVPVEQGQVVPLSGGRPAVGPTGVPVRFPHATREWLLEMWTPWLIANTICVAIWGASALASDAAAFWPVFVAGPWGVVLVVLTVVGLAKGEPQRWAVKKARKRARRARRYTEDLDD